MTDVMTRLILIVFKGHYDWGTFLRTRTRITPKSTLFQTVLNPTVSVVDEDIKEFQSLYRPLRDTTHYWFPLGHWTFDCNSSETDIQPIHYPFKSPFIKPLSPHSSGKNVAWDYTKGLTEVQADDISALPLFTDAVISSYISQTQFAHVKDQGMWYCLSALVG